MDCQTKILKEQRMTETIDNVLDFVCHSQTCESVKESVFSASKAINAYEDYIAEIPECKCKSCHRLFPSQCFKLKGGNNMMGLCDVKSEMNCVSHATSI